MGLFDLDKNHPPPTDANVSPADAGKELCERVMTAEPLGGTVGAYSQIPLNFICRTQKIERTTGGKTNKNWASKQANTAMSRDASNADVSGTSQEGPVKQEDELSTKEVCALAIVKVENFDHEELKVQMMVRACYPDIKISKQQLQFGECAANDRRDYSLKIENRNEDLPLDFAIGNTACFKAMPSRGKLLAG